MGKALAKVPKIEDFKTPWEEKGEDVDPAKAKTFVHFLTRMKAEMEDERDDARKEAADFKRKFEEKVREGESAEEKREREAREADETKIENLRLRVAIEKELDPTFVDRLRGKTREEIEKDADELIKVVGTKKKTEEPKGDDEGEGDEGEGDGEGAGDNGPRTQPRRDLRNPGDHQQFRGGDLDEEKFLDSYIGNRAFG